MTRPPAWHARAWAVWGAAVGASFAALEAHALRSAPGHGTLSAQLRRRRVLSGTAIALGSAWLIHHIVWAGTDLSDLHDGWGDLDARP